MPKADNLPAVAVPSAPHIGGSEAAALLLLLFGEEEAAGILSRLEPSEVKSLGEAMFAVANVNEADVNIVFDRFIEKAGSRTTIGYRAEPQIRGMMNRALGDDRADKIMTRIAPPESKQHLDQLKWLSPEDISGMIAEEHPQIMAVVLSHLEPETAGQVLQQLPEDMQGDVIFRVATMGEVSAEALADVENLIARHKKTSSNGNAGPGDKSSEAAAIMNNVGKAHEKRIIKALTKRDKKVAQIIEEQMFVFDDLAALDEKSLGTLLRSVESDNLILALKGADPKLVEKIFGCMSSRAVQSIQDEMEDRGAVSREDVNAAQKQIVAQARILADGGLIQLGGQGDDYL